jgi:hypothetical protein
MSLLVATRARLGDLVVGCYGHEGRSGDRSTALQICEISLRLGPGAPSLEGVVLSVKIICYKGNQ